MLYRLIDFDKEKRFEYHLLSFNVLPKELKIYRDSYEYFKNFYESKIKKNILNYRITKKDNAFNSFIELIKASIMVRKYIKKEGIVIVYLYSDSALYLILFSLFKKVKYIFDCRGDIISEQRALGYSNFRLLIHKTILKITIPRMRKIFISSTKLRELFIKWRSDDIFYLNSNYYDDRFFKLLHQYKASNITGFIYIGGVAKYQLLEDSIKLFKDYNDLYPDSELILLVLDNHDYVRSLLEKHKVSSSLYTLKSVSNPEVINEFLNNSDIGIMLRDDNLLNYYALPTKFAEYLAAGLPVIATKGVYDTWKMIQDNSIGVIVDLKKDFKQEAKHIHEYLSNYGQLKKKCAEFAYRNLSWSANIERIYNEILSV
jgi:glycosyltransferase involved in cell wall biosynthesis